MNAETGRLSDVSDLQRGFKLIAVVEDLGSERIDAHGLLKNSDTPNAPLLETIDKVLHQETGTPQEPTFAQRNRIITRRQSRRTINTLMYRRHVRRYR
nr:hypothetical protein [Candidatus Levybacteria bacterium]